jgi:hypothetical protein
MLYKAIGLVLDSIHRFVCGRQKTTTFRRLDLSPSSGGWGRINLLRRWIESKTSPIALSFKYVESEVLTAVVLGYNAMGCVERQPTFRRNVSPLCSACCLLHSGFLLGIFFNPEDGMTCFSKRRLTVNGLHGVVSQ